MPSLPPAAPRPRPGVSGGDCLLWVATVAWGRPQQPLFSGPQCGHRRESVDVPSWSGRCDQDAAHLKIGCAFFHPVMACPSLLCRLRWAPLGAGSKTRCRQHQWKATGLWPPRAHLSDTVGVSAAQGPGLHSQLSAIHSLLQPQRMPEAGARPPPSGWWERPLTQPGQQAECRVDALTVIFLSENVAGFTF